MEEKSLNDFLDLKKKKKSTQTHTVAYWKPQEVIHASISSLYSSQLFLNGYSN